MDNFKNIVNILVVVYLIFAILVIFDILGVSYYDANFTRFNPENFYYIVFIIGTILLLLKLITDLMYAAAVKRERALGKTKIDQLKAEIYDLKLELNREARTDLRTITEPLPPVPVPNQPHTPATDNPTPNS